MTLPSRHSFRNSSPDGLRLSTLPRGHGRFPQCLVFTSVRRSFCFFAASKGVIIHAQSLFVQVKFGAHIFLMTAKYRSPNSQTRDIDQMLDKCWTSVADVSPTFSMRWANRTCDLHNLLLQTNVMVKLTVLWHPTHQLPTRSVMNCSNSCWKLVETCWVIHLLTLWELKEI